MARSYLHLNSSKETGVQAAQRVLAYREGRQAEGREGLAAQGRGSGRRAGLGGWGLLAASLAPSGEISAGLGAL